MANFTRGGLIKSLIILVLVVGTLAFIDAQWTHIILGESEPEKVEVVAVDTSAAKTPVKKIIPKVRQNVNQLITALAGACRVNSQEIAILKKDRDTIFSVLEQISSLTSAGMQGLNQRLDTLEARMNAMSTQQSVSPPAPVVEKKSSKDAPPKSSGSNKDKDKGSNDNKDKKSTPASADQTTYANATFYLKGRNTKTNLIESITASFETFDTNIKDGKSYKRGEGTGWNDLVSGSTAMAQ